MRSRISDSPVIRLVTRPCIKSTNPIVPPARSAAAIMQPPRCECEIECRGVAARKIENRDVLFDAVHGDESLCGLRYNDQPGNDDGIEHAGDPVAVGVDHGDDRCGEAGDEDETGDLAEVLRGCSAPRV